jgi:hypothetical protein
VEQADISPEKIFRNRGAESCLLMVLSQTGLFVGKIIKNRFTKQIPLDFERGVPLFAAHDTGETFESAKLECSGKRTAERSS